MSSNTEKHIESFSWIINNNIAFKNIDRSFILYGESGIPKAIKRYFEMEFLRYPDKKEICINFKNKNYKATLELDCLCRSKIRFDKDLKNILKNTIDISYIGYLVAIFKKIDENNYKLNIYKEM